MRFVDRLQVKDIERAKYWKGKGYDFNPNSMTASGMDRQVKDIERAKYWKAKGYDFDPNSMTASGMDRQVKDIERAKYWKAKGYDFDPNSMTASGMDREVANGLKPGQERKSVSPSASLRAAGARLKAAQDELARLRGQAAGHAGASMPSVIKSHIEDEFEGWEGETIFRLDNGQIWQQSSYAYHYHYAYHPAVMIFRDGGRYVMKVDGVSQTVDVVQLTEAPILGTGSTGGSGCESGHWISSIASGGAVITLEDGSVWQVDSIDRTDSMLWLPISEITVCNGQLINTDDDETVSARRLR